MGRIHTKKPHCTGLNIPREGLGMWNGSNGERTDRQRLISRMEVMGCESSDISTSRRWWWLSISIHQGILFGIRAGGCPLIMRGTVIRIRGARLATVMLSTEWTTVL